MIVMTMKVAQTVGSVLAFIQKADGRAVVHRNLSGPVCRVQKFEYREYRVWVQLQVGERSIQPSSSLQGFGEDDRAAEWAIKVLKHRNKTKKPNSGLKSYFLFTNYTE